MSLWGHPEFHQDLEGKQFHFLPYCQMLNFLKTRARVTTKIFSPNPFDALLGPPTIKNTLASLYMDMKEGVSGTIPPKLFPRWEREVADINISQKILEGWSRINDKTVSCTFPTYGEHTRLGLEIFPVTPPSGSIVATSQ